MIHRDWWPEEQNRPQMKLSLTQRSSGPVWETVHCRACRCFTSLGHTLLYLFLSLSLSLSLLALLWRLYLKYINTWVRGHRVRNQLENGNRTRLNPLLEHLLVIYHLWTSSMPPHPWKSKLRPHERNLSSWLSTTYLEPWCLSSKPDNTFCQNWSNQRQQIHWSTLFGNVDSKFSFPKCSILRTILVTS